MATRDYNKVEAAFVSSEITLDDLADACGIPTGTLGRVSAERDWQGKREGYRRKLKDLTLAEAEKRAISARLMVGEAAALAFRDFKNMKPNERGARFPEIVKQWAAMTGETTERTAIDLTDWTTGKTQEEIDAVKQAAQIVNERGNA